jgi:hypothetical protein
MLFILKLEAKRRDYKRLETITINHLKIVIAQFYIDAIDKQYTEGIKERFAKLLKYYGMESISDEYRIKFVSNDDDTFIETLPFFESYHLTRLDIWILATYYKIPIIILYYPNKALIETNDEYSILTTYYEESLLSTRSLAKSSKSEGAQEGEGSEEDFPEFGEAAKPTEEQKNPNEQGYYFIIAPAIKTNVAPSYSIIFKKVTGGELESGVGVGDAIQYYIPLNILTYTSQSSIIDQQSKQYTNPDEHPQSEDDESAQMKESLRYKNSITQFIQKFKPPSKKGRGDDSSSVGTSASLDIQEETLDVSEMSKKQKSSKPRQRINISSQIIESLAQPESEAVSTAPPKAKKREKGSGKGINIKPFPSQLLTGSQDLESQASPIPAEETGKSKPKQKTKFKKQSIDVSSLQLPTFSAKAAPNPAELSDIAEEQEEAQEEGEEE